MSEHQRCLGYFIMIKPYRYLADGISCSGFSLCTDRKVPNFRTIYNDGDCCNTSEALNKVLDPTSCDCNHLAQELLRSYEDGEVSDLPSFRSLASASRFQRTFLQNEDTEIYSAAVSDADIPYSSVDGRYGNLDLVVRTPSCQMVGYDILDAYLCYTFRRPDISCQLHDNGIYEGNMGLLKSEEDARSVIELMFAGRVACEPRMKWMPCCIFKHQ